MKDQVDPYEVLGIAVSASREEAHVAYRSLAARYHPDRCTEPGAAESMSSINRAWRVVGDDARRREFDADRAAVVPPTACGPGDDASSGGSSRPTRGGLRWILVATTLATCAVLAVLLLIAMSQSGVRG